MPERRENPAAPALGDHRDQGSFPGPHCPVTDPRNIQQIGITGPTPTGNSQRRITLVRRVSACVIAALAMPP